MKLSTYLLPVLCTIALVPGILWAQDEESCGVCEFEGDEIVGSVANYQAFLQQMADAEIPLREYTQDSLASIEMGSSHAVRDFSHWYRHRIAEQNADEIRNQLIARIVQQGLEMGLNYFLPGSGAVASTIRSYGVQAYGALVNQMPDGTTDPGPHLQRISESLENSTSRLHNFMIDMFQRTGDQALRDQMDMIKMEYVWEKEDQRSSGHDDAGSRTPGDATRRLLREIGIGPGGTTTSAAVRERVLTRLMRDVICVEHRGNPIRNCETDGWYFDIAAKGSALRLILTGNPARMFPLQQMVHLNRVCQVEQRLSYINMSGDCQRWSSR